MLDGEVQTPRAIYLPCALLYEYENLKFKRYVGTQLFSSITAAQQLAPLSLSYFIHRPCSVLCAAARLP